MLRSLILALALSSPAVAAEFSEGPARDGVAVVQMRGAIERGDYERFDRAVGGRTALILDMESPGGVVVEAVHIARRVRAGRFETSVRRGLCASACAMIWVAGERKNFGAGARIGFHGPYQSRLGPNGVREVRSDAFGQEQFTLYMRWLDVHPAFERFALSKGPDELNFLSRIDAVALGLKVSDAGVPIGRRAEVERLADLPDPSCLQTVGRLVRDSLDEEALAACFVSDILRVRSGGLSDPDARHRALRDAGFSQDLTYVLLARYDTMATEYASRREVNARVERAPKRR